MKKAIEEFIRSLFVIIVIMALAAPTPVLAQDIEPTPESPSTEVVTDSPTEEPTLVPTDAPTEAATVVATAVVTEDSSAIVNALAQDGSVLVDEEGNSLSMASAETAAVLAGADPWFYDSGDPTHAIAYFAAAAECAAWIPPANALTFNCFVSDTPVQSAINDDASEGATINLTGTFTESITITKSVTLDGNGATTFAPITIPGTNGMGSTVAVIVVDGSASNGNIQVILKNLFIDGSGLANFGPGITNVAGILINQANVALLDSAIANFISTATTTASAVETVDSDVTVSGNDITNNTIGINVTGDSNVIGEDNTFTDNGVRVTISKGTVDLGLASTWTDQADYAPGSVVTFSGDNGDMAGYLPGERVRVDVVGPNGYVDSCETTVDQYGAWTCQVTIWATDQAVGAYTFTAKGLTSGASESGNFMDSFIQPD